MAWLAARKGEGAVEARMQTGRGHRGEAGADKCEWACCKCYM
jgi:hypothetical protein